MIVIKKILLGLLVLLVILIGLFSIEYGLKDSLIYVFFTLYVAATDGTLIGIPLLISIYKIPMIVGIAVLVIAVIAGLIKHKTLAGQLSVIFGIVAWLFLGIIGLGHGG
ncbi:hypothetical protein BTA51_17785 [Hahella sp. CCB-MM4]|nr:hypothetical protein BTA51_17785 [Hahella sp. CCB-MM4]